jgi:hypothetical protein
MQSHSGSMYLSLSLSLFPFFSLALPSPPTPCVRACVYEGHVRVKRELDRLRAEHATVRAQMSRLEHAYYHSSAAIASSKVSAYLCMSSKLE